jgi:hypothetical protein
MVRIERSDGVASGPDRADGGGPPASLQTFRERLPRAGLERYPTCVWIQQVFSDSGPYTHRTVPNRRNSRHVPDGRELTDVDATQPAGGAAARERLLSSLQTGESA